MKITLERATRLNTDRVLEVDDLAVSFPIDNGVVVDAVKGVSFHIAREETLALVGESGSGKSVTALTLMRLSEYAGAEIRTGSMRLRRRGGEVVEIERQSPAAMQDIRGADISMVFQEPMTSLNPVLTIGDQICEAITRHQNRSTKEARALAVETFRLARVPEAAQRMKQYPHNLSGGMRQRVMIAMALCCRPSLMIADESTTALDVTIQAQMLDLIKLLQREIGMSVLFITHDMGVVAEIADRVCVMLEGRIVEQGDVHEIYERPQHPYTQALLAAVPRLGSMADKDEPEKFPIQRMKDTFDPDAVLAGAVSAP
ncbi:MAG: ABC transporter ATP-binding protein [Gammaproteobacteria bacterium]